MIGIDSFQHRLADIIVRKRIKAHLKHGDKSIENVGNFDRLNTILVEEVGEVSTAINDAIVKDWSRGLELNEVRQELIDVITVASAWIQRIENEMVENHFTMKDVV